MVRCEPLVDPEYWSTTGKFWIIILLFLDFFFIYSFIGHTYWKRQLSAVIVSPICCVLQHNPWPKYSTQGLLS
jgi:ABC-type transport system involved in multi-copper enzyme maturation permease subunit